MGTRSDASWKIAWSGLAATALMLLLTPRIVAAVEDRVPWDDDRVGALVARLIEQAQGLEADLRAAVAKAEAATENPKSEVDPGPRTVVLQDLGVLGRRGEAYRQALATGQGMEETRSLYGRIESLVKLTGSDMRHLPDYAQYRASLEALEATVKELGLFYAEHVEREPPPDPLDRFK